MEVVVPPGPDWDGSPHVQGQAPPYAQGGARHLGGDKSGEINSKGLLRCWERCSSDHLTPESLLPHIKLHTYTEFLDDLHIFRQKYTVHV